MAGTEPSDGSSMRPLAVVVLAALVGAGMALLANAFLDDDARSATNRPTLRAADETTTTAAAAPATSTTSVAPSTTVVGDVPELSLPSAVPTAPPSEPLGVYREGELVLTGSVPTEELAAKYLQRAASVIGEDNVAMQMTIDPRVAADTMTIEVDEQFRFPSGRVEFNPEFEALLNLGVAALQLLPESTLVITGHTDSVGDEGTNQALSVARAQVVVDFMVERGIPAERIVARGAGESEPIAPNDTPEGREANRRVEATLEGITPG